MQLGLLRTENLFKSSNRASNVCRGQNADATPTRTGKHSVTSHDAHVLMALRCAVLHHFEDHHVQSNNHLPDHTKRTF